MKYISRATIQKNPNTLFVFGDNDTREGMGGMAKEFRHESNTIGIRVKKKPSTSDNSYYTDDEFLDNCIKISDDVDKIYKEAERYLLLYVPDGIGTGLACLDKKAPKTFKYLQERLQQLKDYV